MLESRIVVSHGPSLLVVLILKNVLSGMSLTYWKQFHFGKTGINKSRTSTRSLS